MTRTRPRATRTIVTAGLAVGTAVVANAGLGLRPPLTVWFGPVQTPVRLVGAVGLGAVMCVVLASWRTPREVPDRFRRIAVGVRAPLRGRAWLAGQVLLEEAIWRGCLFAILATAFGVPVAILVSSLGFGVWHRRQGMPGMLGNTINGLTFALSYRYLGGLPAAVLTHLAHNLVLAWMLVGGARRGDRVALTSTA